MSEKSNLAPVAVFAFNRPDHLGATLRALAANELAAETTLHVFLDGPRNDSDREAQKKILELLSSDIQKNFKAVKLTHSEKNKGLANSIIFGVTKIVNEYGRIIVLEDDLVTSKYFLRYMNDGLNVYENEEKVISIHAYVNILQDENIHEPFFLKGSDCWGWATWKRGWALFEPNGQKLLKEIQDRKLESEFNFENSYNYFGMLKAQVAGKVNSWAVRWYAAAFLNNKLTLYPAISFVKNIGLDGSGAHCDVVSDYEVDLAQIPVTNFPVHIEASKEGYVAYCRMHNSIRPSLFGKIILRMKRVFR